MGDWFYTYDGNGNLWTQTDAKGDIVWQKYYGGNGIMGRGARQTRDGRFIVLATECVDGFYVTSLILVDADGNSLWRNDFTVLGGEQGGALPATLEDCLGRTVPTHHVHSGSHRVSSR